MCFGILVYASIALKVRERPIFGLGFFVFGFAAVVLTRRLTKAYTLPSFALYTFAMGCLVFGLLILISLTLRAPA